MKMVFGSLIFVAFLYLSLSFGESAGETGTEEKLEARLTELETLAAKVKREFRYNISGNYRKLEARLTDLEALIPKVKKELRLQISEIACPSDFSKLGSECFYIDFRRRRNWKEAREECKLLGADLAEPEDFNSFLEFKNSQVGDTNLWLGLSDLACEGQWKGVSGQLINMTGQPWYPGDPNNTHDNEHCLVTWDNNLLADAPCDWLNIFACEYIDF